MNSDEDKVLVLRAQRGESTAFDALHTKYTHGLTRYCARLLRNEQEGEQAAQDTFVLAWKSLSSFQSEGKFVSWLNAIATHVCLKLLRTKKGEDVAHRQSLDDPATLAGVEENQSTTGSKDRVAEVVEKRLLEQQIRHRVLEYAQNDKPRWDALELDIFELYYIQGVETKREVAERLGENENKVKYRIYRRIEPVLKRVRQEFEAEHEAI